MEKLELLENELTGKKVDLDLIIANKDDYQQYKDAMYDKYMGIALNDSRCGLTSSTADWFNKHILSKDGFDTLTSLINNSK